MNVTLITVELAVYRDSGPAMGREAIAAAIERELEDFTFAVGSSTYTVETVERVNREER